MKLIIQHNRIAATATDAYTGPDLYLTAPEDFDESNIGNYIFKDGVLTLNNPPKGETCSPTQGLVALYQLKGITESVIDSALSSIPDEGQRYISQLAFRRATEWRRDSDTTQSLAFILGLSSEDLDALFTLAPTILV